MAELPPPGAADLPSDSPTSPRLGPVPTERLPTAPYPYVIERRIGSGGMGVVYEGVDVERHRRVAIKQLPEVDADALLRFKGEFRVVADLSHPNLVTLYELISVDGSWMIVMELVRGDSLRAFLTRAGEGRWDHTRRVFAKLARAVAALHEARVLHLDIKPANVMVEPSGRVVLLDFGLAQVVPRAPSTERARRVAGTAEYLAPEQARGESPRPASDWYAFGVVLYEMLTGQLPFDGPNAKAIFQAKIAADGPPPSRIDPYIPADLDRLCQQLLARSPIERPTADAVLAALGPSSGVVERAPRWTAPPPTTQALVGRGREMAELEDALVAWGGEQPAVMLVEGGHGLGKTRVVERFGEWAATQPEALVIAARCDVREAVPYRGLDGLVDALARALAKGGLEVPLDEVADAARLFPVLARLLPDGEGAARGGDREVTREPELARVQSGRALAAVLRAVAAQRKLVLIIDDLHLGDEGSARLWALLLSGAQAPRALWVCSVADGSDDAPMVRALREVIPGARSVWLSPLAADSAEVLAGALLPGAPPEVLARIAVASGGHPLVLEQLVAERGEGFRALDELTPAAAALLAVLAVSGRPLAQGLAVAVAGLGGEHAGALASLRAARLARGPGVRDVDVIDCSSERLRAAVLQRLTPDAQRTLHRALAARLEDDPTAPPDELVRHWVAAGEPMRAAGWAQVAGERAARALAFERAAACYAQALALGADDAELHAQRARSLGLSGARGEAAQAYLAAAARTSGPRAAELSASACEELMLDGQVDAATALLRGTFGLSWPSSARARAGTTLARLVTLMPRVLALSPRRASSATVEQLARVDLWFSAAKGFLMVEPTHSQWFGVTALAEALRAGEPQRLGRSLAIVGAALVASDSVAAWWGRQMLQRAHELAAVTQDPYLAGVLGLAEGHVALDVGRWGEARAHVEAGLHTLRTACTGADWECALGELARLRVLEELGDGPGLAQGVAAVGTRSRARGDRYTTLIVQRFEGLLALRAGDVTRARALAASAREAWASRSVHLPLLYVVQLEVWCDLYEGQAAAALARVEAVWPELEASGVFALSRARADAELMRAQAAVAAALAAGQGASVPRLLGRDGLKKRRDLGGARLLLEASVRPELAMEAAGALSEAGQALLAAAARDDHAALAAAGVAEPALWLRLWSRGATPPR